MTLAELLIEPFADFGFMRRALIGSIALGLSGAPVGVFLMLRRMSLTGDAMAHAVLPGAAIGYLLFGLSLGAMTAGGMIAGFAVALAAGAVARVTALREDASLAAFYLISLALGVTIVSARGSSVDLMRVLFGSVLALDDATLILLASISSLTMLGLAALYRPLVMDTADPGFLGSVSRAGARVHMIFLALVVMNLVAGFHAIGTLLAVGLMILPAATARLWSADMTAMIFIAIGVAIVSCIIGLIVSFHASLSTGPTIILVIGAIYIVSLIAGSSGGILAGRGSRRHLEA